MLRGVPSDQRAPLCPIITENQELGFLTIKMQLVGFKTLNTI